MSQHHYSQKFAGSEFLEEGERLIVSTEYIRSTTRSPANIGKVGLIAIQEKKKKEVSKEVDIHLGFIIGDLGVGKTTFSSGIISWINLLSQETDIANAEKLVVILDLPAPIHLRDKDLDEIINKPLNTVIELIKKHNRVPKIQTKKHFFIATGPEAMSSTELLDPGEAAERIRDVFFLKSLKDLMAQAIAQGGEVHVIVLKCDLLKDFAPVHYTIEAEYTIKEYFDIPLGTTIEVGWFNQFVDNSVEDLLEEVKKDPTSKAAEVLSVLHTAAKKLISTISGEAIEVTLDINLKAPKWE